MYLKEIGFIYKGFVFHTKDILPPQSYLQHKKIHILATRLIKRLVFLKVLQNRLSWLESIKRCAKRNHSGITSSDWCYAFWIDVDVVKKQSLIFVIYGSKKNSMRTTFAFFLFAVKSSLFLTFGSAVLLLLHSWQWSCRKQDKSDAKN